ncbi:MAG: hypothetical protein G01um101419_171 [Parcubacteria group bacterium Gr01-1014_19]|nr:MAG: hypothetical protein G01um101419_171 [Parcubacteria group bacterium Gr01-1014_19]
MEIIYARQPLPVSYKKSIFLAGPTPRSIGVQSWRPEAIRLLEAAGYDGVVFNPEDEKYDSLNSFEKDEQINWEHKCLDRADCILFWIPRDLATMPALTTNVEFGLYVNSGRVVLGAPPEAPKNYYLQFVGRKEKIPQADTLVGALYLALKMIGEGAYREAGECEVPLNIWRTPYFQSWYGKLKSAGHRLDGAKVQWVCRAGKEKGFLYAYALHMNIWVDGENRNKTNEVVVARPDISSVLLYRRADDYLDSRLVLVREFRSPACNDGGFVWELPGGSSKDQIDWLTTAVNEVHEETGLKLDRQRFEKVETRQLIGPFSSHRANLFAVELTEAEMADMDARRGIVYGDKTEYGGEMTYVEVWRLRDVLSGSLVDWSQVGMILSVLAP